jgi:5-methylcytosine-specific restriction endonuclease McrA
MITSLVIVTIFDSTLQPNRFGYIVPMICEKTSMQQLSDGSVAVANPTKKQQLAERTVGSEEDRERRRKKRHEHYLANKERENHKARAWKLANADKVREKHRQWYLAHPNYNAEYRQTHKDEIAEQKRAWIQDHREEYLARLARGSLYYQTHKEQAAESGRLRYQKNRDKRLRYSKEWRKRNPEKSRRILQRRKALVRNAPIGNEDLIFEWRSRWINRRYAVCYWCKTKVLTSRCQVDHIVPLAKGGSHSVENLCISCEPCNHSKHAKMPDVWNQHLQQPTLEI